MKKKIAFILTLAFMLGACNNGGGNANETTAEGGTTAQEETTTTAADETPQVPTFADYETLSPSLYEKHEDYFKIGVATKDRHLSDVLYKPMVIKNFNSITCENEMKPDAILDQNKSASDLEKYNLSPAINTTNIDKTLKFAEENGIVVRYHTLVWHSQTPAWFFKEGYSMDSNAKNVTREVMIQRMEGFIKQVIEYIDTNYPNTVYAVDVVNEAIEINDSRTDGIRTTDNLWFEVVGADYPELAFTYARKYAPDYMKLYYNDYGCHNLSKRFQICNLLERLLEDDLVDGMGLQSHYAIGQPTSMQVQETIQAFADLGLEIQITELDISAEEKTEEAQWELAIRYKKLMNIYKNMVDQGLANITSVTVWGLVDGQSWLRKDGARYPLLFNDELEPKPAFWGFYLHDSIPNY